MSSKKVFISYSRDDREFVERVVESLRNSAIDVWFDYHLLSGQDWDDALEEQILNCDHMIIVLSKTSVASDNVKNEMRFAMDHQKHIHPIYIEDCSVPLSMRRMHYIDFVKMGYDKGINRLVQDINQDKGTRSSKQASSSRSSKVWKLLAGIIIGILIISLVIWQFWPFNQPDSNDANDSKVIEQIDPVHWNKLETTSSLQDFIDYILAYKNSELKLNEAVQSAQNLLKDPGVIIIQNQQFSEWFDVIVNPNVNGDYISGDSIKIELNTLQSNALLMAKKQISVLDPQSMDVIPQAALKPGNIIQITETLDLGGQFQINFYYEQPEIEETGFNVPRKANYESTFDFQRKIDSDFTEEQVWKFLANNNPENELQGYLWYLEYFGEEGEFSKSAVFYIKNMLHIEGYVVFENVESNSRYYEILIQNSNSSMEVKRSSSRAKKGDLIAQRSDLPINTVLTGVLELHDGVQATGQQIKAGQICLLEELLTDANGNLWARIKFRE